MSANETSKWTPACSDSTPLVDIETGQMVVHKRRAWLGLMMTAFINIHHIFFNQRLMETDKPTFYFGFETTSTPYHLIDIPPFGLGRAVIVNDGQVLVSNTMGQRHPTTKKLV